VPPRKLPAVIVHPTHTVMDEGAHGGKSAPRAKLINLDDSAPPMQKRGQRP